MLVNYEARKHFRSVELLLTHGW